MMQRMMNMKNISLSSPMGSTTSSVSSLGDDDDLRRVARIQAKKAMATHSPVTNFEAFSLYFHLPLKAAAEKFGVRATAFKKRCRAIGIRHWPYRKVRSLKRSLQELNRCKDNGALNEKQQYQYETYKKQLDKLMAPQTYGIDPSGHFIPTFDDDDDMESGDDLYSVDSPRYGASFSDCSISPTDVDKSFLEYSSQSTDKLTFRKPTIYQCMQRLNVPNLTEVPGLTLRMTSKEISNLQQIKPSAFDAYFLDDLKYPMKCTDFPTEEVENTEYLVPAFHSECLDSVASSSTHDDIMLGDLKYEDIQSLHGHPDEEEFDETQLVNQMDYSNERFFDDVFLQISPDYGCLV